MQTIKCTHTLLVLTFKTIITETLADASSNNPKLQSV